MKDSGIFSAVETLDRQSIEKLQLERLKQQLTRCFKSSKFYHKKLSGSGFEPGALTHREQISSIPFTHKHELRENQAQEPPWGQLAITGKQSWLEIHPTTGTTGMPVYKIWSRQDVKNITDYVTRMLFGIGIRPGDILHNAYRYGLRMGGITVQRVAEELKCFVLPVGDELIKTQIEFLVNLQPTVLFTLPSAAFTLAEKIKERGIDPAGLSLKIGCFSAEPGIQVPATRARLERDFGLKAYDIYGLAEIGPLMAAECQERDGLHWAEDHHLIEIIDPETLKPCRAGESGIVVITDLTADAMPLIRYWTNDMARLDYHQCRCGRTHAKSAGGILGRADDMVTYKGVKFYPAMVENVLRRFDELGNEFKIILRRNGCGTVTQCTVQVECIYGGGDTELLQDRIRKYLREELKVSVEIELIPFGTLERYIMKPKRVIDSQKIVNIGQT